VTTKSEDMTPQLPVVHHVHVDPQVWHSITKKTAYFVVFAMQKKKHKPTHKLISVRTMDFQKTIMQVCKERNDLWSDTVRGRIEYAQDLHAADAPKMSHMVNGPNQVSVPPCISPEKWCVR